MAVNFFIDIENAAGVRQGGGPITSASRWDYTARLDAAGDFKFSMPAGDPKSTVVQKKLIARAYAFLGSQRLEIGAGIIDHIEAKPQANGEVLLAVSGNDLIRELAYRSVLGLKLYLGGNPVSHAAAVAAVAGYAPAGWTITPDATPPNNSVYGYFNGETVLAALIKTGQKSQNHFYRGAGRTLIFGSNFTPSGIRAIRASGDLAAETCAIVSLTQISDLFDLRTRIYPRGSGNADAQLTLRATTRTAPAGYVLDKINNYIEHSAYSTLYGRIEEQIQFNDIGPVSNTTSDVIAASNMLFDATLEYLKQHSVELDQPAYTVALAGCSQLLRPLQTLRVVYRDLNQNIDVNADLNIIEATWSVSQDGIGTTALKVSTNDRLPDDDTSVTVSTIVSGRVYSALPQLNANSYVTAYRGNLDTNYSAKFYFRFGKEVTQLQQVYFEFQILPFESTVKSVGGVTSGSGALPTSVPSTNDTGAGGNNDSGPGGAGDTSATSVTTATTALATATASLSTAVTSLSTATAGLNTATANLNTATTGLNTATAALTSATTSLSTATTSLSTGAPSGGDTISAGQHSHAINVIAGSGNLGAVSLHQTGGNYFLANAFVTGSEQVFVTQSGNHTHSISAHTHTLADHSHTLAAHSHTIADHSHTLAAHSHTLAAHSHTIADHSHTLAAHSHTLADHSHTIAAHSHTTAAHTHSMSNHTHSLNNHTHSLADSLTALYGIFREQTLYTYVVGDLEYSVNGGAFAGLGSTTDLGGGWRRLDITSLVMDANTFRPMQEANTIEIREAASAGVVGGLIVGWDFNTGNLRIGTTSNNGLSIGDKILVAGAALGSGLGSNINGSYVVTAIDSPTVFHVATTLPAFDSSSTTAGTISYPRTGTIDAQLSVRNIIQSIALA